MSYNYQSRSNKRTSDDFDTPCEIKRSKCEPDINAEGQLKLPESANDRLKRLRTALSDPNNDQREHIGWKPTLTANLQANKGNKRQLLVQRQHINPIRRVSQSSSTQMESSPERLQSHKNYIPISRNVTRKPLNQRLQSSIGDRLKVNKSSGPYSLKLLRRQNNAALKIKDSSTSPNLNNNFGESKDYQTLLHNATTTGSQSQDHQKSSLDKFSKPTISSAENIQEIRETCDFQLPLQNSRINSIFRNSNKCSPQKPVDNTDLNASRTIKHFTKHSIIDSSLEFPNSYDGKYASNEDNSIFGKSKLNDSSFDGFKGSQHSTIRDRINIPKTNLDKSANMFGNYTQTQRTEFDEFPNQRSRNSSGRDNIESSRNFPQNTDRTHFFNSTKKLSNAINSQMQKVDKAQVQSPFNSPNNNVNTSTSLFNYSNSRGGFNTRKPGDTPSGKETNIFATTKTAQPRKISIQDRLKKTGQLQNNSDIVSTILKSPSSTPNSVTDDILSPTRSSVESEPEPMEWTDVDVTEVVEQMRKVQKFPPETQTNLQQMLNANNTFAETYQNFREDCNEKDYYIVIDTNVFLSNLGIIKEILSMNLKDDKKLYVYIPWMVIQELDYFKDSKCAANKLQANARKAIMLLNECLGVKGSHVKAQLVTEALEAKSISNNPDDIILACCLQAKEKNHYVMLLSNDTNLRNKAIINKISAYSTSDVLEKLNCKRDKSGLQIDVEQIELRTSILLSVVVDGCLREAYGDLIDQMAVQKPPYTVFYALELMRKYWISVFSSSLQKQCLNTIDKLYDLMRQQNYTGLPETEDKSKFVDLTLALCMFLKSSFPQHTDNINKLVKFIQSSTGR